MARGKISLTIINSEGQPVTNATASLTSRSTGAAASWFASETGGTASTAAINADAAGRILAWVERGAYNATISGTGITTYTEAIDVAPAGDQTVDPAWLSNVALPIGSIISWGGTGDPDGGANWVVADGRALSRSTYATLFGVVGTTFGAGDGSTTFNIPNHNARMPLGAGAATGLTTRTRGTLDGDETVALTAAQTALRTHTHSVSGTTGSSNPAHGHFPSNGANQFLVTGGGDTANLSVGGGQYAKASMANTDISHTHSFSATTGGVTEVNGAAHENMPPFIVLTKIIRVR